MLQKVERKPVDGKPDLLTGFFTGECMGKGIIEDRFRNVRKEIEVKMIGSWQGDKFHMDEEFRYDDGSQEFRNWHVVFEEGCRFKASCPELAKPAIGHSRERNVVMNYRFPVPLFGRAWNLDFDDRMFQLDERTLFEKAVMSKFGIRLADIYLVFTKD